MKVRLTAKTETLTSSSDPELHKRLVYTETSNQQESSRQYPFIDEGFTSHL